MHWRVWEAVCISKKDGGFVFGDFDAFNMEIC